jgi:hypothetical protein
MKLKAFHDDLQALVIRHGAVLNGPVQAVLEPPKKHVTEEGPVTYIQSIHPMTIHFTIKANYTEDFEAFFGKSQGVKP